MPRALNAFIQKTSFMHAPWTLQRFWCSSAKKLAIFLSFFDAHVCLFMQMAVIHFHKKYQNYVDFILYMPKFCSLFFVLIVYLFWFGIWYTQIVILMLSKIYPFKLCTSVVQLQLHKSIQTSAGICGRHSAAVCAPQMQYIEIRDPERNGHII